MRVYVHLIPKLEDFPSFYPCVTIAPPTTFLNMDAYTEPPPHCDPPPEPRARTGAPRAADSETGQDPPFPVLHSCGIAVRQAWVGSGSDCVAKGSYFSFKSDSVATPGWNSLLVRSSPGGRPSLSGHCPAALAAANPPLLLLAVSTGAVRALLGHVVRTVMSGGGGLTDGRGRDGPTEEAIFHGELRCMVLV